eukprot:scpid32574/ scgid27780/ Spondin-2; Differentially expressed in cancerous and non-cancerous lung cells 1; Mindin
MEDRRKSARCLSRSRLVVLVFSLSIVATVRAQLAADCQCGRVSLEWCEGASSSCRRPTSKRITQCSTLVFENGARRDYSISVQTIARQPVGEVTISGAGPRSTDIASFDRLGTYRLIVAGPGPRRLVTISVQRKSVACSSQCTDPATGRQHNVGTTWQGRGCTTCRCEIVSGLPQMQCYRESCGPRPRCKGGFSPVTPAGQCCPVCPAVCSNTATGRYVGVGTFWDETCQRCTCADGGDGNGLKACQLRRVCPSAPNCPGGVDPIITQSNDPCCPQTFQCPSVPPTLPWSSCESNSGVQRHGIEWRDGCQICQCRQGVPVCIVQACPPPPFCPAGQVPAEIAQPATACCPQYSGCKTAVCKDYSGVARRVGSVWREPCSSCTCSDKGVSECNPIQCPPPPPCPGGQLPLATGKVGCCDQYTCPKCCEDETGTYAEGDSWSRDSCTQCRCSNCSVQCSAVPANCPDLQCPTGQESVRRPGECCHTTCKRLCPWECGEQLYAACFRSSFTSANFRRYPASGRLRDLLLFAHEYDYTLWTAGQRASRGFIQFVRTGDSGLLAKDLLPRKESILKNITASELGPGDFCVPLSIDHRHSVVSGAAGISPSPDWFVGPTHTELCDSTSGQWKSKVTVQLLPYDAGINKARKFLVKKPDYASPEPVHAIEDLRSEKTQFYVPGRRVVGSLGELVLERVSDGCPAYSG